MYVGYTHFVAFPHFLIYFLSLYFRSTKAARESLLSYVRYKFQAVVVMAVKYVMRINGTRALPSVKTFPNIFLPFQTGNIYLYLLKYKYDKRLDISEVF